jgi:hypothetical protein
MYKDQKATELSDNDLFTTSSIISDSSSKRIDKTKIDTNNSVNEFKSGEVLHSNSPENPEKVVYFFKNGTFREYFPVK